MRTWAESTSTSTLSWRFYLIACAVMLSTRSVEAERKLRPTAWIRGHQIQRRSTCSNAAADILETSGCVSDAFTRTSLDPCSIPTENSRRGALKRLLDATLTTGAIAAGVWLAQPGVAQAAPPIDVGEADNLGARAERLLRPKPPRGVLRPKLNLDFAVLLMRSSYNALDEVDCVPMDQFQRDFFIIRQAEYQYYNSAVGPGAMQQGQLVDPLYFDFISFAQYATISREMAGNPPVVFEERQPQPGEEDVGKPQNFVSVVVRRDPSLLDNRLLPAEHSRLVGTSILRYLDEKFGDTKSSLPFISPGSRPPPSTVLQSLEQLVKLFLINGFAFGGEASIVNNKQSASAASRDASGTQFSVKFTSPATLWSGRALQMRKANPVNDFFLKAATVLLFRAGYDVLRPSLTYTKTEEITTFTIK